MSNEIHAKDIGQEKQVFEVTLPTNQIEKIQICVGNAYESTNEAMSKYNIYHVDKALKKVTGSIGYYELPKDKKVLDKDNDFDVRGLGEDAMIIDDAAKQRFAKGLKKPPVKPPPPADSSSDEGSGDESSSDEDLTKYGVDDEQSYMRDYFDTNYKLGKVQIVPTYLKNLEKPANWANDVAVSLTGIFSNVYIIYANEQFLYTESGKPTKISRSKPLLDLNMGILPSVENLPYDKSIEYVIVSYKTQRHYRLVQHAGKVKFKEEELPDTIIQRFCKKHHTGGADKGVDDATFDTSVIETASSGDCFFDSLYRATRADDPAKQPSGVYLNEVYAFRKEIAKAMQSNKNAQNLITQIYTRQTTQNLDSIRDEFYKKKNGSSALNKSDKDIFGFAITSIFGVNKYDEDDFTIEEKQNVLTNFLTLFYEFLPDTSEPSKDKFKDIYNGIYGYGQTDIKSETLIQQREKLRHLFEKPPKPAPKKPAPKIVIDDEPPVPPVPPKPATAPAPVADEPAIDIPDGTEERVVEIINIYKSSDSDKKEKLAKYNKTQLTSAWEIIMKSVPGLQPKSVAGKTVDQLKQCLAGDQTEKCVKQTKKAKGGVSSKHTRKKI